MCNWFSGSKTYSDSVPAVFMPFLKDGSYGRYWSSTVVVTSNHTYILDFNGSNVSVYDATPSYGYYIHCLKN